MRGSIFNLPVLAGRRPHFGFCLICHLFSIFKLPVLALAFVLMVDGNDDAVYFAIPTPGFGWF